MFVRKPPQGYMHGLKWGDKMAAEIVVAVITLMGSALGTFGGILLNTKLTNYRLGELEKKVDKHNQVIDRVYKLESRGAVIEEDIKVANHRIDDLEEYHK